MRIIQIYMTRIIFVAILLLASMNAIAQTSDKRIDAIVRRQTEMNTRIAEAEKSFPESDIFLTELVVNQGGTMYPAVGHFKETVTFYYTYGNREVSPYPNRILKITVSTERSSRKESAEFFFDAAGKLILARVSDGEEESQFYFTAGRVIGLQKGKRVIRLASHEAPREVKRITAREEKLLRIFSASLE